MELALLVNTCGYEVQEFLNFIYGTDLKNKQTYFCSLPFVITYPDFEATTWAMLGFEFFNEIGMKKKLSDNFFLPC